MGGKDISPPPGSSRSKNNNSNSGVVVWLNGIFLCLLASRVSENGEVKLSRIQKYLGKSNILSLKVNFYFAERHTVVSILAVDPAKIVV